MAYLVIILTVLLFISLFLYLQLRKEVKEVAKQLRYTRDEKSSFHFFTTSSDRYMKEIVEEVNIIREENQKNKCGFLDSERKSEEMIANISHDIRTPLTSIQGYVEMMQTSNDATERERYYQIVTNRLHDLETMLDEFFVYTKLINMHEDLIMEEKAIYPILCKSLLNYIDLLKANELEPEVICEDESICTLVHEESLQRICMNLIINTIRYGKAPYRIELKRKENEIELVFNNTCGRGEEIDTQHMFDRFYKGNQARTQKGSGLGLAIVSELTQRMNGSCEASYKEDVLSITIHLPIHHE
ncbi:sensor histidine kinase [Amedibacillus sp. YH-ame6]